MKGKLVFDPKTQRYYPALKRRTVVAAPTTEKSLQKPIRTLKHLSLYIGGLGAEKGTK